MIKQMRLICSWKKIENVLKDKKYLKKVWRPF